VTAHNENLKNSHVSGTHGINRLKALHAALRDLYAPSLLGLAGVLLHGGAGADTPAWDCRASGDGLGWQCTQPGASFESPAGTPPPPAPETVTPAQPPVQQDMPPPRQPTPAAAPPVAEEAAAAVPPAPPQASSVPAQPPAASPAPRAAGAAASPAPPQEQTAGSAPAASEMTDLQASSEDRVTPSVQAAATGSEAQRYADGLDAGIDWGTCQVSPSAAGPGDAQPDATLPIQITADAAVAEMDPQLAVFSGDVQLVQGAFQLEAEQLTLNRATGEVQAQGGLLFTQPDIRVAGSAARYQLDTRQGQVDQASYRVPTMRARGDAAHAEFLGEGRSRFQNISYTTCAPGDEGWLLSAEALELDRVEGLGTAHHAKLRFMGVPFLYAPVFTFPIDNRRRSGLLLPTIGQTENTGFDLRVPYYFNLAPNYDLTVVPRLMSDRGVMLGGEFRFLTESSRGTLSAEYLPDDRERDGARGSASLYSRTTLSPQASAQVRLNYVSDSDYLQDFGESLAVTSATHLERAGEFRYSAKTWDALARVQYYQTIDDAIAPANRPYSRMPQLAARVRHPDGLGGLTYHLDAEYVNFYRRDTVRGHRIDLFPGVSLPLRETWGYVEPKVGARYTGYQLTDQKPGLDDAPSNLSGVFSLDSGLYFDRGVEYFATPSTHTLEPRLFYLLVPRNDQDDQPVFDTGLLDFNFDNLFRENRFNGPDRLGDANQVTLALTSRVIGDETGAELLRTSLGQILYFEDREVTLPGETTEDDSNSALVAEIGARLGSGWGTKLGVQWDPNEGSNGKVEQSLAQLTYRDRDRHVFNAAYRLRDGVTEQTDFAFYWPINEQFTLIGRHNHSLQDDRLLEALVGVEYGRCCWRARALVRQYTDGTGDDQNLAFFVQLELNGLGRLGDDIDTVLDRGIYGYGKNDYE